MEPESSKNKSWILRIFYTYFFIAPKPLPPPEVPSDASWRRKIFIRYKRWIGMAIPILFFHFVWWSVCIRHNHFVEFIKRYRLSIITVFGATSGGITAIGGGVIAFPVMTFGFTIPPPIARDFSIMCQATAMLSASFLVLWMNLKLEWRYLLFCTVGTFVGIIVGFELIDELIPTDIRKLGYSSIWSSCAFAFFLMQRKKEDKKFYDTVPNFGIARAFVLTVIGFIGGVSSAIVGVDYVTFPIRGLLFRVNDKIAIPTSVVLMTINTLISFYWRQFMSDTGIETESWKFLAVVVPIVAIFGPFGAFIAPYLHGYVKAFLVFALSTVALVSSLCLVPMNLEYGLMVAGLIIGGCIVFTILYFIGERINRIPQEEIITELQVISEIPTINGTNLGA